MLDQALLEALKEYTSKITNDVVFRLHPGEHAKRAELLDLLEKVSSLSDRLFVEHAEVYGSLESPVTFEVLSDGESQGVMFSGVPGGHEFNSFVLAFLRAGGIDVSLDETVQSVVKAIKQPIQFQTVVSLSCHNCPDVVQTLNDFALINPLISHEMIDGGLFPDFVEKYNIQGVPSVILNGEAFASGKVEPSVLVSRLQEYVAESGETSSVEVNMGKVVADLQDMVVLGGGPAGVAAAIYGARKGVKVTLVAERFGGQVKDTMGIENLISVPSTTGPELAGKMRLHLEDYPMTIKEHFKVTELSSLKDAYPELVPREGIQDIHLVHLSSGEVIAAKTLILATGARWRELGVPGEKENLGQGVAYCPHCDGPFFKGKNVAVVGGGNSGVEAALDLAGIVEHVTVLEFMPELKADQVLVDQLQKRPNIDVIKNAETTSVIAENGKVIAVEYKDRGTGDIHRIELAGIFVQIGLLPNSDFVGTYVEKNRFGEIVINERCATNRPGVYAAGDVSTTPYKQIVIAMGEGSKSALSAFEYLLKNDM